jgi:multiple sugar transport system substrate-binding protein
MARKLSVVFLVLALMLGSVLGSSALAKTKITMWTFSGGTEVYSKMHEALMPEFYKEFPDVELEIQYIPDTNVKYTVAYAANAAPDIVSLRTATQASFVDAGMLAPIDPTAFGARSSAELEKMLLPGTVQTLKYRDGKIYFMATEISVFGMFYNKDLFEQSGIAKVPTTWDEMIAVGSKFTQYNAEGKATQIGLNIPRGWIWPAFTLPTLMQGYGLDAITADNKSQFSLPGALKGIGIYPELLRQGLGNATNGGTLWNEGKAAMNWGANYMISTFNTAKYVFNWSAAPMPKFADGQRSTVSYALGHFVNSQSKNKELAWKVIAFFTGQKTVEKWYNDFALWHPWRGAWLDKLFEMEPLQRPFLEALEYSRPEISHPKFSDIRSKINAAEIRIWNKQQGVETAMQQLDAELAPILAMK